MIPIPQSPWTLAIAELIGMRLATLGSGAHPADVLANLLPGGEQPPAGWLDSFLAGTPVPGLPAAATAAMAATSPISPAQAAISAQPAAPLQSAASQLSELKVPIGQAERLSAAGSSSDASPAQSAPAAWQLPPDWQTVQRMLPGGLEVNPSGSTAAPPGATHTATNGFSPSQQQGHDARVAPTSGFGPHAIRSDSQARPPSTRSVGKGQVQVQVELMPDKFASDVRKLIDIYAQQAFARNQFSRDAQINASRRGIR